MKKTIERIEGDRYTGADARRDFAWRDERAAEHGKRPADLENEVRARRARDFEKRPADTRRARGGEAGQA